MLKIYICEDDRIQREKIIEIIEESIMILDLDMSIDLATKDPYELLTRVAKQKKMGVYFLDINLQTDINGIQLGEKIRKYDPRGFIIFITTHVEMSSLTFTYKVEALDYIIKDEQIKLKPRIRECLMNINGKCAITSTDVQKTFYVKNKEKTVHMAYEDIIFFETSLHAHKILLHSKNKSIEFYGHMKEIEDKLDERFLRCHQSYIINVDYVEAVDKINRNIYFKNGQTCLISIRGMKKLNKAISKSN